VSLLVVTSVAAEREAVVAGLPPDAPVDVAVVGVGPAAAAAATSRLLALAEAGGTPYPRMVCVGIGGGFGDRVGLGGVVLGTRSVAADLGAASPAGFLSLDELGFGPTSTLPDPELFAALHAALPYAVPGAVLTVSTVTGTTDRAVELRKRYPDAAAEGMEGYGIACAASLAGVGYAELRAISNAVGPRDRGAWKVGEALAGLTALAEPLAALG